MPAPSSPSPLRARARLLSRLPSRPGFYFFLTGLLMVLGFVLAHRLSERSGREQLSALSTERLELYASNLAAELGRHASLPSLLAIDPTLQALMLAPDSAERRHAASQMLARVNVRAGTNQIFVADGQGQVLSASETLTPPARLAEALVQDRRHFFAADPNTGSTDFYLLHPLRQGGRTAGVIVVRFNLAPLEATWIDLGLRSQGERILVADDQDVVIMSSVQAWKYAVLDHADPSRRKALQASARYPQSIGPDLELPASLEVHQGQQVQLPLPGARPMLAQQRQIVPLGLRLVALSDLTEVKQRAQIAAWGGAAFGASVGLAALYLASRRRALRQLTKAQTELQQAHGQLEQLVDSRTAELRQTNDALKSQIAQRLQTEGELLQASKLAVLGQMSAGLSHEVNQPLTALRALARNSIRLLESGRNDAVAANLQIMDDMVERMSQITRQLKNFARKADEQAVGSTALLDCVRNALLLLEHRSRTLNLQTEVDVPAGLRVRAEANRLEQVLVNLFGNAIDAMQRESERRLRVQVVAEDAGRRALVRVQDSGAGLSEADLQRLFEPFFTTKPAGEGLGLGLVISAKIVHEFGGRLRAERLEQGMSFEFDLAVETWAATPESEDV
ncbi:sensor histidine kinase [Roseateles saccharophilus]|uniref:C4-dicarboxylate transport sensor protein DctB n=1 Tax=Roseateles saccharophilus TaxID=304 RepID=A0A4R3VEK2_ROSSA|nr:ATP-binding protein [Roseateles saccharophilus]MDG0832812.1 sensor histidine kinase [Roseateles saccharophilus]TCV03827.1 two-component system C4-dicarboxylate transport sensor histidine kinase DctB [Roseateles saccharophilus]